MLVWSSVYTHAWQVPVYKGMLFVSLCTVVLVDLLHGHTRGCTCHWCVLAVVVIQVN